MSLSYEQIRPTVERITRETPIVDMHTHLYPPTFKDLLLWGIDELLTYHYLIAEVFRAAPLPYEKFWQFTKAEQADYIWKHLFVERSPISEAQRGVLTCLKALGIDVTTKELDPIRAEFSKMNAPEYINTVLDISNVKHAVMTNDPFDPVERECWENNEPLHPRLHAALRIDPVLSNWDTASSLLNEQGYNMGPTLTDSGLNQVRKFLENWADRMQPRYMAVSLTPDFLYPDDSHRTKILDHCILPMSRERKLPFALMIGVKRQVNPNLKLAGDAGGKADLSSIENLCADHPDNKFLTTLLSRENQHELCVMARKFPNLMVFGCWWFLNNPYLIEEMTRMRCELLGSTFVPQHSDARVLDQLIYKWSHSRKIIGNVLADKYEDLAATGWLVKEDEIQSDVKRLFETNFEEFVSS